MAITDEGASTVVREDLARELGRITDLTQAHLPRKLAERCVGTSNDLGPRPGRWLVAHCPVTWR